MKCKRVILAVALLVIVGGVVGSVALAAPAGAETTAKKTKTVLDPFTLRTLTLEAEAESMSAFAAVSGSRLTRQAIRVPTRPQTRSAFKPNW
jgi:hypothetical protein